MKIINQDMLKVKEGILCHQVNCQGVMGGGIALQIAKKWPHVEKEYKQYISKYGFVLGASQLVIVNEETVKETPLFIANIFGQDSFGAGKQTSYVALALGLNELRADIKVNKKLQELQVYFPYMIGCGLGGGKWEVVSELIEEVFPSAILCKL